MLVVSTYRWASQGQKLGVFGRREHQWIDAYVVVTDEADQVHK